MAVSGWPGEVKPEDFTGVVVHSAMREDGTFRNVQFPAEPVGAQHHLGTEGKFRGCADGLSAEG